MDKKDGRPTFARSTPHEQHFQKIKQAISFKSESISSNNFQVMACENALYILPGEKKPGNNDVNVEAAEVEPLKSAREIPYALATIATCKRRSPNNTQERSKLDLFQEEEEYPTTPKSEKHKIPVITCCPPAPRKPRLTPTKRKPAIPSGTFYIPFHFPDLDLLFGSESKSIAQHTKKKQQKIGANSICGDRICID
ncbi:hypothetical protein SUGI_0646500 [Cryptomeria japonica]|nr:hypothetical protein SUGI_0646500 [Cryptomeria japonica]